MATDNRKKNKSSKIQNKGAEDAPNAPKRKYSLISRAFKIVAAILVATSGVAGAVDHDHHHSSDSNHGHSPTLGDNASKLPAHINGTAIIWDSLGDPGGFKEAKSSAKIAADKPAASFNTSLNPESRRIDLDPEGATKKNYIVLKPHSDYFKTHSDLENGDGKDYANNTSLKERLNGEYYSLDEHGNSISVSDKFDPTVDLGSDNYFSSHVTVGAVSSFGHGNSLGANITAGPNFHVGDNTIIYQDAVIGKNVRIGSHVVIGPGAIIGDGCTIADGTDLQDANLGPNTEIRENNLFWSLKTEGNNRIGPDNKNWPVDKNYRTDITLADGAVIGKGNYLTEKLHMGPSAELGSNNTVNPNVTILGDAGSDKTLGNCTVPSGLGHAQQTQPVRPNAHVVSPPAPALTKG